MKDAILKAFAGRDLGVPTFFLGMHVRVDRARGTVELGQQQYIVDLLARFGMTNSNAVRLPMAAGAHLSKAGVLLDDDGRQTYQELVGAVQYLATCTRPDVSLVAGRLGRYAAAPTVQHMAAAKTLLRYVKGTAELGLRYGKNTPLVGYADADYAGDVDNRRSTTGLLFLRNGGAVAWKSKLQASVAASTTEAEYVAGAMAAREAVWLRRLDKELGGGDGPVKMLGDNQGSLAMMRNPISSTRTKHIAVCYHFVRDKVAEGVLSVSHVPTEEMAADALTKPLRMDAHERCRAKMGLVPMARAAPLGWECCRDERCGPTPGSGAGNRDGEDQHEPCRDGERAPSRPGEEGGRMRGSPPGRAGEPPQT